MDRLSEFTRVVPPSDAAKRQPGAAPVADISEDTNPTLVPAEQFDLLSSDVAQLWLSWQCQMVSGVIFGAIFAVNNGVVAADRLAAWPDDVPRDPILNEISQAVVAGGQGVIRSHNRHGLGALSPCDIIGCPLVAAGQMVGVVVMIISTRSGTQQRAILQLLQWGALWIDRLIGQRSDFQQKFETFSTSLVSAMLERGNAQQVAMEAVNRLAEYMHCRRVSLGIRQGVSIQLLALAYVPQFDTRTQIVRRLEAAMEEAADQSATILEPYDPVRPRCITRAHKTLLRHDGGGTCCTVLLTGRAGPVGALVFERGLEELFDDEDVSHCEIVANLVGHILEMKLRSDESLLLKGRGAVREFASRCLGPGYLRLKLALVSVTLALLLSTLLSGEQRITAAASIQGAVRHMLVAPQQGYVRQADARAGDIVKQHQLIAQLDDRDLRLELQKWQGEKNRLLKIYQEALALRDRSKLSVTQARMEQAEAEYQLVESRLSRSELRAPIDGVVVYGDFSQSLGAPVEKGQVLFEVAPLDSYLVVLEVDEFDVADLREGKAGRVVVTAFPSTDFAITVSRIVPVAIAADGRNYFAVEATLDQPSPMLRPGMAGIAKLDLGERRLLWLWTHTLLERLQLWFWARGL
jgi:RND family efflux transporter MFP subunit